MNLHPIYLKQIGGGKRDNNIKFQTHILQRSLLFQRKCQSMSVVNVEINVEPLVVAVSMGSPV